MMIEMYVIWRMRLHCVRRWIGCSHEGRAVYCTYRSTGRRIPWSSEALYCIESFYQDWIRGPNVLAHNRPYSKRAHSTSTDVTTFAVHARHHQLNSSKSLYTRNWPCCLDISYHPTNSRRPISCKRPFVARLSPPNSPAVPRPTPTTTNFILCSGCASRGPARSSTNIVT